MATLSESFRRGSGRGLQDRSLQFLGSNHDVFSAPKTDSMSPSLQVSSAYQQLGERFFLTASLSKIDSAIFQLNHSDVISTQPEISMTFAFIFSDFRYSFKMSDMKWLWKTSVLVLLH